MRRLLSMIAVLSMGVMLFPTGEAKAIDLTHSFVIGADAGFDVDPELFALDMLAEYQVTGNVAVGPLITFGVDSTRFLFGMSGFAKYKANLVENSKLKPYGFIGIGFMDKQTKNIPGDKWTGQTKFLIPVGGGFEYWQTDRFAWGADIVFNVTDNIFFSMLFGVRTRF